MSRPTTKSEPRTGLSNLSVKNARWPNASIELGGDKNCHIGGENPARASPRCENWTGRQQNESQDEGIIGISRVVDEEHRSVVHRQELRSEQEDNPSERPHKPENPLQAIPGHDRQYEARTGQPNEGPPARAERDAKPWQEEIGPRGFFGRGTGRLSMWGSLYVGLGARSDRASERVKGAGCLRRRGFGSTRSCPPTAALPAREIMRQRSLATLQEEPNANGERGNRPNKCEFGAQCRGPQRARLAPRLPRWSACSSPGN